MTSTLMQFTDPATAFGPRNRGMMRCAIHAIRRGLTRAGGTPDRESRNLIIKQDLAHLDRNQLRDIGLDRDAL